MYVPLNITLTLVPQESSPDTSSVYSLSVSVTHCDGSDDTVILSPSPSERQNPWPAVFPIPTFSHNTELALSQGNEIYLRDGTLLTSPSVKADILEHLAKAMFCYTKYPNDAQRSAVAQALIEKHPCLKEPGSFNGIYGWQLVLSKISIFR